MIATCQRNILQHCWVQYVACVWPPCCNMLGVVGSILTIFKIWANNTQHVATRWPNARNILRTTMLRYVALACCDRLAGALVAMETACAQQGQHLSLSTMVIILPSPLLTLSFLLSDMDNTKYMWKVNSSTWHKCLTKKQSESPTGIERMTSWTPGRLYLLSYNSSCRARSFNWVNMRQILVIIIWLQ